MLGLEMMLSSVIGLSPDELKAVANRITTALETASKDLKEIKERLDSIEEKINVESGDRNSSIRNDIGTQAGSSASL